MEDNSSSNSSFETPLKLDQKTTLKSIKEESKFSGFWNFRKCYMCSYRTKSSLVLRNHMKRHRFSRTSKLFSCTNNIENFQCDTCTLSEPFLINLKTHMEVFHKKPATEENELKQRDLFLNDLKINNFFKNYFCEKCTFNTYSKLIYIRHCTQCPINDQQSQQSNVSSAKSKCRKCSFEAKNEVLLYHHMRIQHKKTVGSIPTSKKEIARIYLCSDCDFFTERSTSLKNHILSKHIADKDVKWYRCDRCKFKTKWRSNIYHHVKKIHLTKTYKCSQCNYHSKQQRLMDVHIMMKHTSEPKQTLPSLDSVLETATKDQQTYRCSLLPCLFKCKKETELLNHIDEKHLSLQNSWIVCTVCSYRTIWEEKLKEHMELNHTPNSIFGCEIYDFHTEKNSTLGTHMNSHNMEVQKWLECVLCSYKSISQNDFRKHILEMHVIAETVICFKCQICMFRTIEEKLLKEHILEKHIHPQNSNWLQCAMCPFRYQSGEEIKKHIFEKHII